MPADSTPQKNWWAGVKRAVRNLAILLAALAVAFGLGYYRGRAQLAAVRSESVAQVQSAEGRAADTHRALQAAQASAALARACTALYQAVLSLDERNFGTADTHLRQAAAHLGAVDAGALPVDVARLQALQREVEGTSVSLGADLSAQRAALAAMAERAAALMEEAVPGNTPQSPAANPTEPGTPPPHGGAEGG
ncbi:MAG: hypothetical protein QHJ73_09150 [Armatimonadota bacterium]|nr:hypothetical protein [Armatimonadota bacterium]